MLLLLDSALVLCAVHGTQPIILLPLAGAVVEEHYSSQQLSLYSAAAVALDPYLHVEGAGPGATVQLRLGRAAWRRVLPELRRLLQNCGKIECDQTI